jgi:stearoyl-CoA desaturase (delta-9 desaturase)
LWSLRVSVAAYREDVAVPEISQDNVPELPRGIIVGGPAVRAKQRESMALFFIFMGGSIAGLYWAFTQGVTWIEWSMFALMYSVTTVGLGVTVHRMLVHRSFKAGPVMKFILCMMGQLTCQGSLLKWVGNHRRHHLYTDEAGDPHSPHIDSHGRPFASKLRSWMYANNGWLFDDTMTDNDVFAKDMLADPMVMFFTRTRWGWYFLSMVGIPAVWGYAFGGLHAMWGCILFAGFLRTYLSVMATATVNSVCHKIGYRRFDDANDHSTNHLLMTVLTFGEGLHNNHHRFPRDAYLSHAWYEFDLNGLLILGLEKLGLVTDVVHASKAYVAREAQANG